MFRVKHQQDEEKILNYSFNFNFRKDGLHYSIRIPEDEKHSIVKFNPFSIHCRYQMSNFLRWERLPEGTIAIFTVPKENIKCHNANREKVPFEEDWKVKKFNSIRMFTQVQKEDPVLKEFKYDVPEGYVQCYFRIDINFANTLTQWKKYEIASHLEEFGLESLYYDVPLNDTDECTRLIVQRIIDLVDLNDPKSFLEWCETVLFSENLHYQDMILDILRKKNKLTWRILIYSNRRNFRKYAKDQRSFYSNGSDAVEILKCRKELQQRIELHTATNNQSLLLDCERKLARLEEFELGGAERDQDF